MTKRRTTSGSAVEGMPARAPAEATEGPSRAMDASEAPSEPRTEPASGAPPADSTRPSAGRSTPRPTRRRFRSRTVELPEGETLTIDRDGTIRRHGSDGTTTQTWPSDDPSWSRVALHFGLHAAPRTITPSGRQVRPSRPAR